MQKWLMISISIVIRVVWIIENVRSSKYFIQKDKDGIVKLEICDFWNFLIKKPPKKQKYNNLSQSEERRTNQSDYEKFCC